MLTTLNLSSQEVVCTKARCQSSNDSALRSTHNEATKHRNLEPACYESPQTLIETAKSLFSIGGDEFFLFPVIKEFFNAPLPDGIVKSIRKDDGKTIYVDKK